MKGVFVESEELYLRIEEIDEEGIALQKKGKKNDRTVKDILQIVAKWRNLQKANGKKATLEESASSLGIPRSTLDDYYVQIRLGEKYGFDFEAHFQHPFGVVRKFVKENHATKEKDLGAVMNMLQKYQPN